MLFRKFKNTTQQEVAAQLRTTQQYISELEKNEHISGDTLNKILLVLKSNKEEWEKFKRILPNTKETK